MIRRALGRLGRALADAAILARDAHSVWAAERARRDVPRTRDVPGMPNSEIDRKL